MISADRKWVRVAAIMSTSVTVKATLIYLGYLIGRWVDQKYQCAPYGMTAGLCVGTGVGLWWLVWIANRVTK